MDSEEAIKVGRLHGKARRIAPVRETRVELRRDRLVAYQYDSVKETTLNHFNIVNQREVKLEKTPKDTEFGFTFVGGFDFQLPIKINKVYPDTPAERSGEIQEGDVIFNINGVSVWGKTHSDLKMIAKDGGNVMTLHLACLNPRDVFSKAESESLNEGELTNIAEIPLLMASVCKYERGTNLVRSDGFEVVSSNGKHEISLYFNATTVGLMNEWFAAISDVIRNLNTNEVKKWNTWTELEAYEQESVTGWLKPEISYNLHQITVKDPREIKGQSSKLRVNSVVLQSGTGRSHILSFDSKTDIDIWHREFHNSRVAAVNALKRQSYKGKWNDTNVTFTIDSEHGFVVEDNTHHTLLWSKPFSRLKGSHDDGCEQLHLEFGKHGTETMEMLTIKLEDLHLAVCTIEAFMVAKVASQDSGGCKTRTT